jgi:hypothetical protein
MKRKTSDKAKPAPAKGGKKKTVNTAAKKAVAKVAAAKPRGSRQASSAPSQPDAIDALVTAGAAAMKLPLDPAWHGGVKFNLQLILRMGGLVDEFPLPDDAEPGPVFYA